MHIPSQEYEYIYIYNIAFTIAPAKSQIPVRKSSFIVHRDSTLEFGREESLQRGESGWRGGWRADLIRRSLFECSK